jgi:hypothetical protein
MLMCTALHCCICCTTVCATCIDNSLAGAFAETFSVTNVQDETNTQVDISIYHTDIQYNACSGHYLLCMLHTSQVPILALHDYTSCSLYALYLKHVASFVVVHRK